MDQLERHRKRLHLLMTKFGELTPAEKSWILYLEDLLTAPTTKGN